MEDIINQQENIPTQKETSISKENVSPSLEPMLNDVYSKGKQKAYMAEDYLSEVNLDRQVSDSYFQDDNKVSMTRPVDIEQMYTNVKGDYLPNFPDYRYGSDNAERAARQQSTGSKWANGLTKAGAQVGSTVLGGTIGSFTGVHNWITSGFDWDALYTDDFNKSLDEFNERLQFTLPNYYTKQEQDMNFGQSLGTANFWANDLSNGIAFTLGAMVSEGIWAAATGGTSLAGAGARLTLRAGKLGKLLKGINGSQKEIGKLVRASAKSDAAIKKAKRTHNLVSGANTARFMYTSAGYEAGVEARQFMKESKENFENYFQEYYGREPNAQERADFENNLTSAANGVWAGNMAVVGGSNLAVFGRMFRVTRPLLKSGKKLLSGFNKKVFGIGTETSKEGGKFSAKALVPSKFQKAAGYTQSFGKSAVIEGFWEEGNQSVLGNFGDDWLASGYEEGGAKDAYDFMGGLYDSYAETYGSKEGWKEIGIGMMVGALGGGISGQFGSYSRALKNEKSYADAINSAQTGAQITADKIMTYARMVEANKAEQSAVERGDMTAEELARKRGILSYVAGQQKYDRSDESFKNFKAALDLVDTATVAKENGISESEVAEYKASVLEEFKSLQDSYIDNKEFADMILGESPSVDSKLDKSLISDAIAYNMTMGKEASDHADIFLDAFVAEISSVLSPQQAADFKDASKLRNGLEKASKEKRARYNNAQKTYNKLNRQRNELEKKIKSVQRKLSRLGNEKTDQKKQEKDLLLDLTEKLNELEMNEIPRAKAEWETVSNLIITNKPFSFTEDSDSGFMVTSAERLAEISQIDDRGNLVGGILKKIDDSLEQLRQDDPKAYQRAKKMLTEYKRSVYAFKEFNKTIQGVANPNFKPTNLVTKMEKLFAKSKGKTENEFTREFYANIGKSIIEDTEFQLKEDVEAQKASEEAATVSEQEGDKTGSIPSDMTQKEFNNFRDNNVVSKDRLQKIADKLKQFTKNKPDKSKTEAQVNKNKSLIEGLEKQKENLKNSKDSDLDEIDRINSDETKRERQIREIDEKLNLIKSDTNYRISSELGLNKYEQAVYLGKPKEIESLLQQGQETNEVKRLKNLIKKALQKNSAIASYIGEDVTQAESKKPTEKEMDEFRELHSRIKRSKFKSIAVVANGNPKSIKESQGDNIDLSVEEIEKYQELNDKLSSWQVQQGTMIDGLDSTLADLIIRLQQLNTNVSQKDTNSEQTTQDHINIVQASDRNSGVSRESKEMVQTPTEGVFLGVEKNGKRTLSHVTVEAFINKYLPKDSTQTVFIKLPGKKTKQQVESIEQLTSTQKQEGVTIYIEDSKLGTITINVGKHSRLEFTKEQWAAIENDISLKFFYAEGNDPNKKSFLPGVEVLTDGTLRVAQSDFTYDTTEDNQRPSALPEEMYDVDNVQVFIDPKNQYDRELLEKLEQAKRSKVESAIKEARENLMANMYVHYMRAGKIIGVARAGIDSLPKSETSDAYLDMRKKAADALENTKQSNLIDMKTTIPIGFTYYGSPIFNLVQNEDGTLRAEPRAITKKDSDKIVDAGYVKNGKLFLGNKVDKTEVLTQYLPNTDQKIPVVIFKYKGKNVAFPVSLVKRNAGLLDPFNSIMSNPTTTDGQKVNEINDFLIQNGIDPKDYNLKEADLVDANTIEDIQARLDAETTFADIETWTKEGFNLSRLRVDALTSIDIAGKPFHGPKLKLNLANKENTSSIEDELGENIIIRDSIEEEIALEEEFIENLEDAQRYEAEEARDYMQEALKQDILQNRQVDAHFAIHNATAGLVRPKDFDNAVDRNTRKGLGQRAGMFISNKTTQPLDDMLLEASSELGYELTFADYADYVDHRDKFPEAYRKKYIRKSDIFGESKLVPEDILAETKKIINSENPLENVKNLSKKGVTEYQIDIVKDYINRRIEVRGRQEAILGKNILKKINKKLEEDC